MARITKIEPAGKKTDKKLRVAAYARVSTDSDEQLTSLKAQKEYFDKLIRSNPKWEYAGLYYDEGISGTKMAKRDGLLQMLNDCEKGKIDYIIVKSISRFSRNTLESIEMVRKLCGMGIYLYFEKENIDTGKMEGELLLSILSSLAENESRSTSDNVSWGIQKRFQEGTFKISCPPYGYRLIDGEMVIDEEKAVLVRRIFTEVLAGNTPTRLATIFNKEGIPPVKGKKWHGSVVRGMLRNEKYCGDVLFQKTYTDDNFNRHYNYGKKDQYYIPNHHEPIIDRETFEAANRIIEFNAAEKGIETGNPKYLNRYTLSGKIICGECGCKWKRRIINGNPNYICTTHLENKKSCGQLAVRTDAIEAAFMTMMNKLTYARKEILVPLQGNRMAEFGEKHLNRLEIIDAQLEKLRERKQAANRFFAKGLLDPAVHADEMNSISIEETALNREREEITSSIGNGHERQKALTVLLKYTARGEMLTEFDDNLLEEYVDHIVIYSREELGFVMKCGPEFRERMIQNETHSRRI